MNSKEKILITAKKLFSSEGFSKLSMRRLAKVSGVSVATIYHHFPDKSTLYLKSIQYAFVDKAKIYSTVWASKQSAKKKLQVFIKLLIQEIKGDPEFHRLLAQEIMMANPQRMKLLANDVFKEQFEFLKDIMNEISPEKDAHLLAISVLSLCKYHIEIQPLRQYLSGWKPEHETLDVQAEHIIDLLLKGLS